MKKAVALITLCVIFGICLNSCGNKQIYYYGNYSKTLYGCEKNNDEASFLKHKEELDRIIAESEKNSMLIPPGICAELGFLHLKNNDIKKAVSLFEKEAEIFPESKHLMTRLIQMAEKKQSKQEEDLVSKSE